MLTPPPVEQVLHPELWTLLVHFTTHSLRYVLYSDAQKNSVLMGETEFDLTSAGYLKAAENAVYDTPLLLDDYKQVLVVASSAQFMLLPPSVASDESLTARALAELYDTAHSDMAQCDLPQSGIAIAYLLPAGLQGFLRRTFNNPRVVHRLQPLCRHAETDASGATRLYVNIEQDHTLDVVLAHDGKIEFANTFQCRSVDDALYYVLGVCDSCSVDRQTDQILMLGDKSARDALTAPLRKYVGYVMPMILPAATLRLGQNAVKAPVELVLMALGE